MIRDLTPSDIPQLSGFAPAEWNCDISAIFGSHYGKSYFHAIVAVVGGKLVGCGNGVINGDVGWLGNIIVLEEHRRQGIGRALTEHLVGQFGAVGCRSLLLIATPMGEALYRKLGFSDQSRYEFYDGPQLSPSVQNPRIHQARPEHSADIIALDRGVSGENRKPLIRNFLTTGFVMLGASGDEISGIYLPDFGGGLIEAVDDESGLALLHFKQSSARRQAVIPEQNRSAREFLVNRGYTLTHSACRMALGPEVAWKPQCVFGRATGYTG